MESSLELKDEQAPLFPKLFVIRVSYHRKPGQGVADFYPGHLGALRSF